ncbi:hypothetical protein [Methylibium sp.]|uniref:hypothetical protein n=1 Tax=Methylibium sp. TaxID=2067992 RepID=UPI0017EE4CB6|nr:hypothetical protein [Methylibium sp.]MBA3590484.1 hypothetical protein [Methylibium sp.]
MRLTPSAVAFASLAALSLIGVGIELVEHLVDEPAPIEVELPIAPPPPPPGEASAVILDR